MTHLTAWFDSREQADAALFALRCSGAACTRPGIAGHGGDPDMKFYAQGVMPVGATLQLRIPDSEAARARALIRNSGGRLVFVPSGHSMY